ncbi:MAG: hypothetical protein WC209_09350 [Ignavibacteriaceae bacterium]|jgi:hypothetical protein
MNNIHNPDPVKIAIKVVGKVINVLKREIFGEEKKKKGGERK